MLGPPRPNADGTVVPCARVACPLLLNFLPRFVTWALGLSRIASEIDVPLYCQWHGASSTYPIDVYRTFGPYKTEMANWLTEDAPVNARDICGPEKWVSVLTGIITEYAHRFFRSELLICIYENVPRSLRIAWCG